MYVLTAEDLRPSEEGTQDRKRLHLGQERRREEVPGKTVQVGEVDGRKKNVHKESYG